MARLDASTDGKAVAQCAAVFGRTFERTLLAAVWNGSPERLATGLEALGENIAGSPRWPEGEARATREALRCAFSVGDAWGPAAVIDVARRVLPRDTVATVDTGAHRILLSQMWECYAPRTLLQTVGSEGINVSDIDMEPFVEISPTILDSGGSPVPYALVLAQEQGYDNFSYSCLTD